MTASEENDLSRCKGFYYLNGEISFALCVLGHTIFGLSAVCRAVDTLKRTLAILLQDGEQVAFSSLGRVLLRFDNSY